MSPRAASTADRPKDSPLARDSDSFACALSRASCFSLALTSCGAGATFHPSTSSAVVPLRPIASLRYDRAVAAAIFFTSAVGFFPPLSLARSRTYLVPEARSTTGSARRATPWTTGLMSSRPLLMYRSAKLRPVVTRVVLCRGFSAQSVVGTDFRVTVSDVAVSSVNRQRLVGQSKVCSPDRRRLASNCGARVCA